MRSDGSKNLSAPKIIKQITAQNTPTAPIIADFPLLFLIKSIKITTKRAVIEKSIPVKSIGISWLKSEPSAEPAIQ
jgi:hypothetical protein